MAAGLLKIRNERVCKNYISYLSNQDYASASIHRKLSSLNSFYNFLLKEELIQINFFECNINFYSLDLVDTTVPIFN